MPNSVPDARRLLEVVPPECVGNVPQDPLFVEPCRTFGNLTDCCRCARLEGPWTRRIQFSFNALPISFGQRSLRPSIVMARQNTAIAVIDQEKPTSRLIMSWNAAIAQAVWRRERQRDWTPPS